MKKLIDSMNEAIELKRSGDVPKALKLLTKAIKESYPEVYHMAFYNLGKLFYLSGDYDSASASYIQSLHINMTYGNARILAGEMNIESFKSYVSPLVCSPVALPSLWQSLANNHAVLPLVLTQTDLLIHLGHSVVESNLMKGMSGHAKKYLDTKYTPSLLGDDVDSPDYEIVGFYADAGLFAALDAIDLVNVNKIPPLNYYTKYCRENIMIADPEEAIRDLNTLARAA